MPELTTDPEVATLDALDETPHDEVFSTGQPRTVRLRLADGEEVPRHTHPGTDIVLHVVSGRLELALDDDTYDLEAGQLARFSGEREISPRAVENTTAVVVFAPAGEAT